jgi:hypothetical protein
MFCTEIGAVCPDERLSPKLEVIVPEIDFRKKNINRRELDGEELVTDSSTLMTYLTKI